MWLLRQTADGELVKRPQKKYAFYRCQNKQCKCISITKFELESAFVKYLEALQPKQQYLKLFNEVLLDVWKEKQAQNHLLNASLQQHISNLKDRKEQLEVAFIFKKTIKHDTFRRQLEHIK